METVQSLITEAAAKQIEEAKAFLESGISVVTITTEEEYLGAGALITEIKKKSKELAEAHKREKAPHLEAGRQVDSEFFPVIRLLDEKAKSLDDGGRKYRDKQLELAAIEQKRLEDAAETERRELEAQAGTKAEKAARLREKAMELTARAAKTKDPQEAARLMQEAHKYEIRAQGYDERAEAKQQQAAQYVAPVVAPAIPQAHRGGFNVRTTYGAKITDERKVLDHLKEGIPPAIHAAIMQWANAAARSSQGAKSTLPGIEFYKI